jgi:hypothetical protein
LRIPRDGSGSCPPDGTAGSAPPDCGQWVIPEWERVADECDVAHFTVLVYLSSATRALQVDPHTASVIAGWDPESTIWLTDASRESAGQRQA